MAYLLLLAVVGTWACIRLRDRPLVQNAHIFFLCGLLALPAEITTIRLFDLYRWRMQLLANPEADMMVASIVVAWLNPLLGLLYADYCRRRPVLRALLAAAALGLVEVVLVNTGFMVYRLWSPLLTAGLFFAYFLAVWRIARRAALIPAWLHLLGFITWLCLLVDIPLQGIWWLWHVKVVFFGEIVRDNRLYSVVPNLMLLDPLAMAASMAKGWQKLAWAAAGVCFLLLIEAVSLARGFLIYDHWSLGLSALKYAAIIAAAIGYERWIAYRLSRS